MSENINKNTKTLVAFGGFRFMEGFPSKNEIVTITKDNIEFMDGLKAAGLHNIVKLLESGGTLKVKITPD